jgi:demethylspheroidene O-methyltransferase
MTAIGPTATDRQAFGSVTGQTVFDRLIAIRDRLLSSARFRSLAVAFPLTRPIARRRTRALFDLCGGFVYSQILFACVQLELFDILSEGPQNVEGLASRLSLPYDGAARLLAAATALDLVSRRSGGRFGLGALGAAMVGNEAVAAMVRHHAILYADLADPVGLLRDAPAGTELSRYWAYARSVNPAKLSSDSVGDYTSLMATSQSMIAEEILQAYPLTRYRRLLDVGGGDGSFLAAAGAHARNLKLVLFDLPPVVERARQRFAGTPLEARFSGIGGDFWATPLPADADIVSLVRVLHDHDDDEALVLLKAIRRAIPGGGALLIAEPMAQTKGSERAGDAYFGFYLLAMRSGRPRTADEIVALLRGAGFGRARLVGTRNPTLVRLIEARP